MTFSEQLLSARQRLGITQPEAAALIGISPRTYCAWELGEVTPLPYQQEGTLGRMYAPMARSDPATT